MPASTTGSLKRRRTDDGHDGESIGATDGGHYIPPKRSEIWQKNTQFRVHRSMLARHSEVFRDMFTMPHPSGEALVEDCPLVSLPMDSAEDVKNMLTALYDKTYNTREALPYSMVAAMIRMGRKYEIAAIRDEGLTRLKLEFPIALAEWEKLPPIFTHIIEADGLLFDIVQLALENDVLSEKLLNGVERGVGQPKARLPFEVQRTCILGRERLLQSLHQFTFAWVSGVGRQRRGMSRSLQLRQDRRIFDEEIWMPLADPTRALERWNDFLDGCPSALKLCQICLEDARVFHEAGRRRAWDRLPLVFDLPEWQHLQNFAN
ncbi:hypothetical protein BKA70DRAFT_1283635 [Coprinopsis sp. MPI-PUGE-AT-0042]|nr:hypothetical protein BKA70DRAFT_1283635 [Coprinopsis sp. MPI-PUGE-AT-0042]